MLLFCLFRFLVVSFSHGKLGGARNGAECHLLRHSPDNNEGKTVVCQIGDMKYQGSVRNEDGATKLFLAVCNKRTNKVGSPGKKKTFQAVADDIFSFFF